MITEYILALLPGAGTKPRGLHSIYGSFIRPTQLSFIALPQLHVPLGYRTRSEHALHSEPYHVVCCMPRLDT
jgi:hypothetical protein